MNNVCQYLNLTYKLDWYKYLDRESTDVSSIFGVLSIVNYFKHLLGNFKNILYILDTFYILNLK